MTSIVMSDMFLGTSVTTNEIGPLLLVMKIARLCSNKLDIPVSSF